jgi:toxin CcdB
MARFDIHPNPFAVDRHHTPFVLDVQNDHLGLGTRVVIPLRTQEALSKPARQINPTIAFGDQQLVVDTASMAPVPVSMLKQGAPLAGLWRAEVQDAIDALFGSY